MIGNRIIFCEYDNEYNQIWIEGLIIDAFGDFGDGGIESKRKYRVEYFEDKEKQHKRYKDIFAWQQIEVIGMQNIKTS